MGDSISRWEDQENDKYLKRKEKADLECLSKLEAFLRSVRPLSEEMDSIQWINQNKEKILRNRKIIELLG